MESRLRDWRVFAADTRPGAENEPMKRHTTFRIGGPARLMALPRSRKGARRRAGRHRGWNRPFFPGKRQQSAGGRPAMRGFVLKGVRPGSGA